MALVQQHGQERGIVAAIKLHSCSVACNQAGAVREFIGLDEVLVADLCGIHPKLISGLVEQAVDDKGCLRTSCSPVGCEGHGIGVEHIDITVVVWDFEWAWNQRGGDDWHDHSPRNVRARSGHKGIADG